MHTEASPARPGKILCIGRNYVRHIEELQNEVPDEPVVFLKPPSALIAHGGRLVLPPQSTDVHHEVELVAVVGRRGRSVPEAEALTYLSGYAVGLDMTARDVQARAKAKGLPWTIAKGFDTFAPLGPIAPASDVADPQQLGITLHVNGVMRQEGHTSLMLFPLAALVAYLSGIFTLEPGDLIYTGTPAGVGPVVAGDVLEARVDGLPALRVTVHRD